MPDSIIKADNISSLSGGGVGFPDGSVSNPSMKFTNDSDTGLYRIGSNTIGIASNGSRVGEFGSGYGGFIGNIIQVVHTSIDTQLQTSSIPYQPITGLTATITPKSASNKILVRYKINGSNTSTTQLNVYQIVRNSTSVGNGNAQASQRACNSAVRGGAGDPHSHFIVSGEYLDSPASTSSLTYQMQFGVDGGTTFVNRDQTSGNSAGYPTPMSSITLMELQQ
jgi:hypothetical protein